MAICERMNNDKRESRDAGFYLFDFQSVTGINIQKVAGLRCGDFTERIFERKNYRCIKLRRWSKRGIAVLDQRVGLQNLQAEHISPLPKCVDPIWMKKTPPAVPIEEPKTVQAHWFNDVVRWMRSKIPDFPGANALKETLINNLQIT